MLNAAPAEFEPTRATLSKVEGEAFGKVPTTAKLGNEDRISGFKADGLASFWLKKSLKPLGTLTSPEFTIERDYINLRIGGSPFRGAGGIKVIVEGKEVTDLQAVKPLQIPNHGAAGHPSLHHISG